MNMTTEQKDQSEHNEWSEARRLLGTSNEAREIEHDFENALALADQAFLLFAAENNFYGMAESLCSRALTFRAIADQTTDPSVARTIRITALHEAQAAVHIANENNVSTAIPLQNLAKLQKAFDDLPGAIESFRASLEAQLSNPDQTQSRPGVLANSQELLATAELALDPTNEDALDRAKTAIGALEASDEDELNKAVWISHGHGRIAKALREHNPELAREHLEIARTIITEKNLELSLPMLAELDRLFGLAG